MEKELLSKFAAFATTAIMCLAACGQTVKKDVFADLINDGAQARSTGHEDRAANSLKEAFEMLPPVGSPKRVECVNRLYPEILALSADLRRSGRFSLSKTMLDKAIEIESECNLPDKKSAVALKEETEKVGEMELSLLKRADKAKELRFELKQLKHTTRDLAKQFASGDFEQVARDGRAHLEVLRKTRGVASKAYCDARRLIIESMLHQGNPEGALKLLEDDVLELNTFKDSELMNADEEAVENALFLSPLLAQISGLQLTLGKQAEAEKSARRSLEIAKILGGKANPDASSSQLVLAIILKQQGKNKEALLSARGALPLLANAKHQRQNWIRCLCTIAELEDLLGLKVEARRDFDQLINEAETARDPGAASVSLAVAAAYYRTQGDQAKYLKLKEEAITLAQRKSEPPFSVAMTYETLGDSSVRFSKFSEALQSYETAVRYASQHQKESIEQKIAACKKNKSVAS